MALVPRRSNDLPKIVPLFVGMINLFLGSRGVLPRWHFRLVGIFMEVVLRV